LNLPFYIARRYLFAKKSHNAINIISLISVCGIAVATIAMVCVLSVFNGFSSLVASMFSHFDPELKIVPATGKVFDPHSVSFNQVRQMPEIEVCTETLEDNVLARYGNRQEVAVAKGVEQSFRNLTDIDTLLLGGQFELQEGETDYAVPGIGLAYVLGVQAGFVDPIEIMAPKRDETVNPANPATSFNAEYAYVGGVFCINQPSYDERFVLLPISLVRRLLHYETEVSSLELKLTPKANLNVVKKQIRAMLGSDFRVLDRYEQQAEAFRMMQIEKWMSFLILAFVLAIALFNVISSLYMLMIEKQQDVQIIRSMGADRSFISRIFLTEGALIPAAGALAGVIIGVIICLMQQHFGIIKLGNTLGAFVSDNYPVKIEITDIILIFTTIFLLGLAAARYPVSQLSRKWQKIERLVIWLFPLMLCCCKPPISDKNTISVTIEPQRFFVEKIAGGRLAVHTTVPAGQSPETYDPSPRDMLQIADSKAYMQIGKIGFELAWMNSIRSNNSKLPIFDLSDGIKWIENEEDNEDHGHSHGQFDPHIWMSTNNAKIISANILSALSTLDAENADFFQDNYKALITEIDSVANELHSILDTLTIRTFVIYHPALTYFADEFHLTQLAIEAEGKEPSAASMKALVDRAKRENVRVVFVQQEFDRKHAEQLATEINASVVVINPLDADWCSQMIATARALCNPKNPQK